MKVKPLVSICCITYNHEPYIRQAIDGFLMQKINFPIEIIIHDDASTDNTAQIIKEYADKYPDIIVPIYQTINQYSLGIKPLQNIVWPIVRGKYIALCEGDDYWIDPYKLQKQVDYLEKQTNVSVVATNYIVFNEITKQKRKISIPPKISYEKLLRKKNIIATLTTCMRSEYVFEYLQELGTYSKNWPVGDYPLWLYMSLKGKIGTIRSFTAVYLKRQQSICHYSDSKKQFSFYLTVIEIANFFSNKFGASASAKKYILKNKIYTLISYGYSLGSLKVMRKWITYYIKKQKSIPLKGLIKLFFLFFKKLRGLFF